MRKLALLLFMLPLVLLAQDSIVVNPSNGTPITATIFMWLGVAASVLGAAWFAFKFVASATPTKKDDEFAAKVEEKVQGILDKLPDQLEQQIKDAFSTIKKSE